MALQSIFGMPCSNLCMYMHFGHRVIVKALKSDSLTKIAIPSNDDIALYKDAIGAFTHSYPMCGPQWTGSSCTCSSKETLRFRLIFTMDGRMVTM